MVRLRVVNLGEFRKKGIKTKLTIQPGTGAIAIVTNERLDVSYSIKMPQMSRKIELPRNLLT